jgi:hypothetical protein
MKQTEVKTDRQTTHRISGWICGHGTGCTALQPDKDLIRYRLSWPNIAMDKGLYVATDKRLYVPMQLLPDNHIAGRLSGKSCSRTEKQPDSRTVKRINNRITVRTSLRMHIRLSRFNNLIFNL